MERASRARSACLFALLVLLPAAARAQHTTHDREYVITSWQTENGLPDDSATAIAQTDDGYLWLGTLEGLVRFDGARFTVFDPANTPGLPSAEIPDLHLDRAGRLWVSTRRGLASLHAGRWRSFGPADGWVGDNARWFAETAEGGLYVATSDGKVLRRVNERFDALPDPRPGNHDAFFPWVDEAGRLCLLQTGFAAAWAGERWQPLPLPIEPELGASFGWARARDGSLLGAGGRTLVRVHGGRVERRALSAKLEAFSSLTEDSRGFTWFSSSERGLYRIAKDGSTRRFSLADGFPSDRVRVVFEHRQGNLWVGTNGGGLVRLRPRRFTSYGKEEGLPLATTSVAISSDGVVHVAATRYGLHEIRGGRATSTPVPAGLADPQTLLVDRSDRLWVGTDRSGLYLSQAGRWTALLPRPRTVSSLFEDSRARVWAGTTGDVLVWDDPARAPRALPVSSDAPEVR
jgi:ligand-binding sensor domain-containing protein